MGKRSKLLTYLGNGISRDLRIRKAIFASSTEHAAIEDRVLS